MKKIIVLLLVIACSLSFAFAKENFRVEAEVGASLNTNVLVTGLPFAEGIVRFSTLDNKVGIVAGYGLYNDMWLTEPVSFFVSHGVIAGITAYNHTLTATLYLDNDNKIQPMGFHFYHTNVIKDMSNGNMKSSLSLRYGLDVQVSAPTLVNDEGETGGGEVIGEVLLAILSVIPRLSFGVCYSFGGAW